MTFGAGDMNRYEYTGDSFDRNNVPSIKKKKEILSDLRDEIVSVNDDDIYILGWSQRCDGILDAITDYWKFYNDKRVDKAEYNHNRKVLREALERPTGRKMIVARLEEIINE